MGNFKKVSIKFALNEEKKMCLIRETLIRNIECLSFSFKSPLTAIILRSHVISLSERNDRRAQGCYVINSEGLCIWRTVLWPKQLSTLKFLAFSLSSIT